MTLDQILTEMDRQGIETYEEHMESDLKGIYCDKVVWLNSNVKSPKEKVCILAEELGHYHTSSGNILDLADIRNQKQEKRARGWAYEKLIPLQRLVEASKEGVRNRYELAEYLDVTEEFLEDALTQYRGKYGIYAIWSGYVIYFEPLGVLEFYE